LMKVMRGKFREVSWVVYVLTAIFVLRFIYLSRGA
jgi:xanthine/uracil/vitamin C permease (AzgA family)